MVAYSPRLQRAYSRLGLVGVKVQITQLDARRSHIANFDGSVASELALDIEAPFVDIGLFEIWIYTQRHIRVAKRRRAAPGNKHVR